MRRSTSLVVCVLIIASGLARSGVSLAEDGPAAVGLELNRLEPQGDACRAYLLIDNSRGEAWRSLKLDLFVLNTDGVVEKRLGLETAPIAARKTSIRVFDLAGLACSAIGRLLLNDVLACDAASGPRTDCLERVDPRSKLPAVSFIK